jgi:hypothetical protein
VNGRRAAAGFAIAVLGSQAGHLLAYQVRFAGAAQQLQSSGAHAYFPALAKAFLGFGGLALLACLFMLGLARVLAGRRQLAADAPSLLSLLAALFTLQLALFLGQESLEARLAGIANPSGLDLVLWGTIGQLPAAAVGAVALRWLFARVAPSVAYVIAALTSPVQPPLPSPVFAITRRLAPAPVFVSDSPLPSLTRRGPPSSSLLRIQS